MPVSRPRIPISNPILSRIRERLTRRFDSLLENPDGYAQRVRSESGAFPEWDLFPYVFPAVAYTSLAVSDPARVDHSRRQVERLVRLVLPNVIANVSPPGGKLETLAEHGQHAVYLGWLNLALGCLQYLGGGETYAPLHRSLSEGLLRALIAARGRPLRSFPFYSWTFDTIPCLVSLWLYDVHCRGARSAEAIGCHLRWSREQATHPETGLPYSEVDETDGKPRELPRGCDLSFRLCLLAQVDRTYAERLYRNYARAYWVERGWIAGFAEWPHGSSSGWHISSDIDSGPLLQGIGLAATGFGVGTTSAFGDHWRLWRLCVQLATARMLWPRLRPWLEGQGIPLDPDCVTGFLFGDVCLFWAATWRPWTR